MDDFYSSWRIKVSGQGDLGPESDAGGWSPRLKTTTREPHPRTQAWNRWVCEARVLLAAMTLEEKLDAATACGTPMIDAFREFIDLAELGIFCPAGGPGNLELEPGWGELRSFECLTLWCLAINKSAWAAYQDDQFWAEPTGPWLWYARTAKELAPCMS